MIDTVERRAEEIFLALAGENRSGRTQRLEALCEGDAALRAEVLSLLAHLDGVDGDGFLDPAELRRDQGPAPPALFSTPVRVADFTILGELGSGGMGEVYIAEQQRPRRTVAVKLLRRGPASTAMVRRLEREAEALGRLQHPGIAQIYAAGTADTGHGPRPFIAMELIAGRPLTEFATSRNLDARARVALLVRVCDAVQHAHQRGIIHRDLKPANILVDDRGQPKILDFGIARVTDAAPAPDQTATGQILGTLSYMSPEQIAGNPDEVDTRSDLYSLGVVAFELLSGSLPHAVAGLSIPEAARRICEGEPARLGAARRDLRGDLETIIARLLEKNPARRYASAAEAEADLQRYLDGQPIAAKADSALYLLRKRLARQRGVAAIGSAALLAVGIFAIHAWNTSRHNAQLMLSEQAQRNNAEVARAKADAASAQLQRELAASTIERARLLGLAGDWPVAEDLLWRQFLAHPASQHAYWALWEFYSRQRAMLTIPAHTQPIVAMAATPDGSRLITGSYDGTIKTWDRPQGEWRCTQTLTPNKGRVLAAALNPDGSRLAIAADDGALLLDPQSGAVLHQLPSRSGKTRTVAFAPAGDLVAVSGDEPVVRLWDPRSGEIVGELSGPTSIITMVRFSPDGARLACVGFDRRLWLWDVASRAVVYSIPAHDDSGLSLAFRPDGRFIATGSTDRTIKLWRADTGQPAGALPARNGSIYSLSFTPDGRSLIAAGWWSVDWWDVLTRQRIHSLGSPVYTHCADIDSARDQVTIGMSNGLLRVWSPAAPGFQTRLEPIPGGRVSALAYSPDGRTLAAAGAEGRIRLYARNEQNTWTTLRTMTAGDQRVRSVRFSPDGRTIATAGDDHAVRLWSAASGDLLATLTGHARLVFGVDFSPDGSLLASGAEDGTLRLWPLSTGPDGATTIGDPRVIDTHIQVLDVRFSPDGSRLATAARDREVMLWDTRTWQQTAGFKPEASPWHIAFSHDGSRIAAGAWSQTAHVWGIDDGRDLGPLRGHSQLVVGARFSPDDRLLATCSSDGLIKLWALTGPDAGTCLATLEGHNAEVLAAEFSPDGRQLASSSSTGDVWLWDLTYFDRAIAGNLEHQITRLGPGSLDPHAVAEARQRVAQPNP